MRSFAIALILFTAGAQAGELQRAPGPGNNINPPQSIMPRGAVVQRPPNFLTAPGLLQPITLTPAAPVVAGLAELDFHAPNSYLAGNFELSDGPYVDVGIGSAELLFIGAQGKHYAINCSGRSNRPSINYQMHGYAQSQGTTTIGQDGHFGLVTDTLPGKGLVDIHIWESTVNNGSTFVLYGCQISPF